MKRIAQLAAVAAAALVLASCEERAKQPTVRQQQEKAALRAAEGIRFTENAEVDNISRRLELTSQPGLLGFVVLLNGVGQPIWYGAVKGKITSSGKRLTPTHKWVHPAKDNCQKWYENCRPVLSPSDEGTWGSSAPYIYFWTTNGQYIQWSGDYLYSDRPFRLTIEPLAISTE